MIEASFSFCIFVFVSVSIFLGLEPTRLLFPARSSHMSPLPAFHSTCSDAVWHLLGTSPQMHYNTTKTTNTKYPNLLGTSLTTNTLQHHKNNKHQIPKFAWHLTHHKYITTPQKQQTPNTQICLAPHSPQIHKKTKRITELPFEY